MPAGRMRSLERSIRHTHGAVNCVTSSCRYVGTRASADAYPQSLQPPHPSPAVGKNARYPRRLRTPEPPPTLEALLYAKEAQRSSPPRPGTLECPPKLAQAIDSVSRVPGKRLSRRREANARWRWLSEHMRKLRLPLGVTVAPMGTKQLSGAEDAWNALRTSSIGGRSRTARPFPAASRARERRRTKWVRRTPALERYSRHWTPNHSPRTCSPRTARQSAGVCRLCTLVRKKGCGARPGCAPVWTTILGTGRAGGTGLGC